MKPIHRREFLQTMGAGAAVLAGGARIARAANSTAAIEVLLDEPIGGMNPDEIDFTMKAISQTREQGVTIVVVEHNMRIMDLLDRVTVINFGHKIAEGKPEEVRKNKEVILAYLGGEYAT